MVSRAHAREGVFTPVVRTRLVSLLREEVAASDIELLAYAFMPTHLHLVLRQGEEPLTRFMQPLLRRAALLVQKRFRREGHVFERRFRDQVCGTPHHSRNAIVYTHLNPERAGLCESLSDYPWTSRSAWQGEQLAVDGAKHPVRTDLAMLMFATGGDRTSNALQSDYLAFESWRRAADRVLGEKRGAGVGPTMLDVPAAPPSSSGNANWVRFLSPHRSRRPGLSDGQAGDSGRNRSVELDRPDLASIARGVLAESAGRLLEAQVRSRWGGKAYVAARRRIALRAAAAGYTGREIATYLRLSPGTVSVILNQRRRELLLARGRG